MQDWVIQLIDRFGYIGITFLIAIENIFPPIPSEIILTFAGFMTTQSSLNPWLAALAATVGSLVGAVILYNLGHLLTPHRLSWIIDRWGRVLRVKKKDLKKAEGWFVKRGSLTVFLCRFIPVIRSLISIPAGAAHMEPGRFLLYTALGTAIWNIVLIYLGALAGENWESITVHINTYSYVVWGVIAVAAVLLVIWLIRKKAARRIPEKDAGEKE